MMKSQIDSEVDDVDDSDYFPSDDLKKVNFDDFDDDDDDLHDDESTADETGASHSGVVDDADFEDKAVSCFRFFVMFLLVGAMIAAGVGTWKFLQQEEYDDFQREFDLVSHSYIDEIDANVMRCLSESKNVATSLTALSKATSTQWPYFTDDSFYVTAHNFRNFSKAQSLAIAPLVASLQIEEWSMYTSSHAQGWIRDGLKWENQTEGRPLLPDSPLEPISSHIFSIENGQIIPVTRATIGSIFAPIWQISKVPTSPRSVVNFDALSNPTFARVFESVLSYREPVLSKRLDLDELLYGQSVSSQQQEQEDHEEETVLTSLLVSPLTSDFDDGSGQQDIVGSMIAIFSWETFFTLDDHFENPTIYAVVKDGCGEEFTMNLTGRDATFIGNGDHHDATFDSLEESFKFAPFLRTDHSNNGTEKTGACEYIVSLYPSSEFYEAFQTKSPVHIPLAIVGVIFAGAIIFCLYDLAVHSRQRRILAIAAQSERILSVLYPKQIRDRLFGGASMMIGGATGLLGFGAGVANEDPDEHNKEENAKDLEAGGSGNDNGGKKNSSKGKKKGSKSINTKAAKYQLKSFINEDAAKHNNMKNQSQETLVLATKPIADLFPNTTVMFADIAGFTAWSSVREPCQVFTLLETVYAAFDVLAKRRRVFKVETVGDCYVAVTGLPEPRRDHALVMCRFARDCVERFNELAGQLETILGPDTADLAIRVGLNSGPVTAGVLRGDKSRFQLFGDTVNTAARIESNGKRNKIHVSMETADLLKEVGKEHWLKQRENVIEAKGKGKLQTYWLLLKGEDRQSDSASGISISDTGSLSKDSLQDFETSDRSQLLKEISDQIIPNLKATTAAEVQAALPPNISRLVKWNVEVLSRLLKKIVAKRNAIGNRRNYSSMLADSEAELRKKVFVLDEVVEIIPLPDFDQRIQKLQEDSSKIELSEAVVDQLNLYVSCMAACYKGKNAFHNFEHASHVMMSVSKLLTRIVAADDITDGSASGAHDHTYGITSDPMTQFTVVLAALVHDVDHDGVSNFQLIKENHKLATLFKGKSIAEQNSIVLAWDTLMEPRFYDLRRCIYTDPIELHRFRQLMTNTVLATDIFDKELSTLRKNRWETAFRLREGNGNDNDNKKEISERDDINRKATIVIEHLIQASDVAHTMQHWHIYRKWNERLFKEMTDAYRAGRMGKDPAEFWYQGELGFFDNYVIPLAKKLKDCGVFGVSSDEYLNYALENRREWSFKGEEVVAEFIRTNDTEDRSK